MILSSQEKIRYSRQIQLREIGEEGQKKLKTSSVLVVGAGGLGSPAALYLAAAGVGRIGILDDGVVELSHLHRQILYQLENQNQSKAEVAGKTLSRLNSDIQLVVHNERLTAQNAIGLFKQYDFVLDGADNFSTRYLSNDAAYFAKKPLITASILGFEGQLSIFNSNHGPCYRCIYPNPPEEGTVPSDKDTGVMGAVYGILGSMQAFETIKLILNLKPNLESFLLQCDLLNMSWSPYQLSKNMDCPLCGLRPKIHELKDAHLAWEGMDPPPVI